MVACMVFIFNNIIYLETKQLVDSPRLLDQEVATIFGTRTCQVTMLLQMRLFNRKLLAITLSDHLATFNLCSKAISRIALERIPYRHPCKLANCIYFLEASHKQGAIRTFIRRFKVAQVNLEIDEFTYEKRADETLDILTDKLEQFLDQLEDKSYDIVFNASFTIIISSSNN